MIKYLPQETTKSSKGSGYAGERLGVETAWVLTP